MAGIIKNQLVKHLSKFTRNLKPEQISLDVLRGKTKLPFIEINEDVLTDILELPSWLRIQRAYCTGVTVVVPWTKLKSSPVQIFIDEINVEVVLANGSPRKGQGSSPFMENNSYGFVDKVVEGMSLYINTVEINFNSDAFGGSFMLQRLSVESRTPGWQQAADLRQTRISCSTTNRTLMYKQVAWHLLRIEASANSERSEKRVSINAPLRLITSGGKIRIALKKHSGDGSVIHARIITILEDILWVATLPQLRSALAFYSYIMSLVRQSDALHPTVANMPTRPSNVSLNAASATSPSGTFQAFDFDQTSYHLNLTKIDLHLCDDANSNSGYPPDWNIESGAMQVTLSYVLIDIYPRTIASSDRAHWVRYPSPNSFTHWNSSRLAAAFEKFCQNSDQTSVLRLTRCWQQLMSFNVVFRVHDVIVQCVSEMTTKKEHLKSLFASERQQKCLPREQFIVHFEFAYFFHPMSDSLPVPSPTSYLQLGPFSLIFDRRTLRWCLYVANVLSTALDIPMDDSPPIPHSDVKIDLLMPKLVFDLPDPSSDRRLPHRLLISLSTLTLSNCVHDSKGGGKFEQITDSVKKFVKETRLLRGNENLSSFIDQLAATRTVSNLGEQFWITTSPAWVDTDFGPLTKPLPVISDVCFAGCLTFLPDQLNVYIEPTTPIAVIIDHFQFLQITRFIDSLSDYILLLTNDQTHFASSASSTTSPSVAVVVAVRQVRASLLLTMGPVPSPYDRHALSLDNHIDTLSETNLNTRSNTPRRVPSTAPLNVNDDSKVTPTVAIEVEEFPEFPTKPFEYDASSYVDDSLSVATSMDDESFEFEVNPEEDLFLADLAEEADVVDAQILNDKLFKASMAKRGNLLHIELENIAVVLSSFNKDTLLDGAVQSVSLSYDLDCIRQKAYDGLKLRLQPSGLSCVTNPQVTFKLIAFDKEPDVALQVNVRRLKAVLDDEIVTHLAAFALEEQETESKLKMDIDVSESDVVIKDRKKKKTMRLQISSVVIDDHSYESAEDN